MAVIYIVSPKTFTGGPESLHQFGKHLYDNGYDVQMYYSNVASRFNRKFNKTKISSRLEVYGVPISDEIIDSAENILVVPETYVGLLYQYKHIRKCIWWLSLEYYFQTFPEYVVQHSKKLRYAKPITRPLYHIYLRVRGNITQYIHRIKPDQHNLYHLYNCEEVRQYLLKIGVNEDNMTYLCGPIEDIYFSPSSSPHRREDIVLYNPKKGLEFTQKIIQAAEEILHNIEFIPIKNMTAEEIVNLMDQAKVYMDFGYFPGPERIPREAVTRGCCIVTSKTGCAGNAVDVPIPIRFKFESTEENIMNILGTIEFCISNYDEVVPEYEDYRNKVILQKSDFKIGVDIFTKHFRINHSNLP